MTLDPQSSRFDPSARRERVRVSHRGVQLTATVVLLSSLVVPAAQAQRARRRPPAPQVVEAPGEASRRAAQEAFAAGEFGTSEQLYAQAYDESANPVMLVGLADARERQGNAAGAVEALERYLGLRSEAPDRAAVEARIAGLRTLRGVVLVTAEPPGEVWLDGERTGYVTPVELTLSPGRHGIAVTLRGELVGEHAVTVPFGGRTTLALVEGVLAQPAGTTAGSPDGVPPGSSDGGGAGVVDGSAAGSPVEPSPVGADGTAPAGTGHGADVGQSGSVDATEATPDAGPTASLEGDGLPLDESAGAAQAPAASRYVPRRAAAISAGVAAGTLVMGTVLGFMALTEQSDFNDLPTERAADRGERLALFSDVMFGIAGSAAVTSIVLYVTERRAAREREEDDAEASRLRLTPFAGRRGAGMGATLQF